MSYNNCDRCGADISKVGYDCHGLSGFIFGKFREVDLCEKCDKEIGDIIKKWWDSGGDAGLEEGDGNTQADIEK